MKSTGIVRKVDDLGRVVLPVELRKVMNIEPRDALEIFVDGDTIVLKKYEPQCVFCGSADGVRIFCDKSICTPCMKSIAYQVNLEAGSARFEDSRDSLPDFKAQKQ